MNKSVAKELLPEAVDEDPCDKRIVGIDEPVGESETVARLSSGRRGKIVGTSGRTSPGCRNLQHQDMGWFALLHLHHHHGGGKALSASSSSFPAAATSTRASGKISGLDVFVVDEVGEEFLLPPRVPWPWQPG